MGALGASVGGRSDTAGIGVERRQLLLALGAAGAVAAARVGLGADPAAAELTGFDGVLLDQGGAGYNVRSSAFGAVGDGATDDTSAIQAAIDAAAPAFGRVLVPKGVYALAGRLSVPQGVDLVGEGNGEGHAGTTFRCTTTGAGLSYGTRAGGGRGGISSGFQVDGNNVATQPLFIGQTVQRTFMNVEVVRARADSAGWRLEATQNCLFLNCNVAACPGVGMELDHGAAGNCFVRCEFDGCGTALVIQQTDGVQGDTHNNGFYHCMFERTGSANVRISEEHGTWTYFKNCLFHHDSRLSSFPNVTVYGGAVNIDSCFFAGGGGGVALTVTAAHVFVSGMTTVNNHTTAFRTDAGAMVDVGPGFRYLATPRYAEGTVGQDAVIYGRTPAPLEVTRQTPGDRVLLGRVATDAGYRFWATADGSLAWASGAGFAAEALLSYWGANRLTISGADLLLVSPGRGIRVAEGANAKQGTATLVRGTATVANATVTASSRILLTGQDDAATGALHVSSRVPGVSFTIRSSVPTDSGVVAWEIFEPA